MGYSWALTASLVTAGTMSSKDKAVSNDVVILTLYPSFVNTKFRTFAFANIGWPSWISSGLSLRPLRYYMTSCFLSAGHHIIMTPPGEPVKAPPHMPGAFNIASIAFNIWPSVVGSIISLYSLYSSDSFPTVS